MWKNFEEVVRFAIQKEAGAIALYEAASRMAERPEAKAMFDELAADERAHRKTLEDLEERDVSKYHLEEILDLGISDYLPDVEFSPDMGYREILVLAMKREEKSKSLYTDLAQNIAQEELKRIFLALAQEEAKHKLRLETEYEKYILGDS